MIEQFTFNLFRGSRPKSYAALAFYDIKNVISLQSGFEDSVTESLYEHQDPHSFGMFRFNVYCSNIFPPTAAQVNMVMFFLNVGDRNTFLHCHSGVDRTGFMVACYRMRVDKWSFREAHAEWVKKGRHWWYFWWAYKLWRMR